jgi:diacylglycerol kinase (ATP)
MSSAGSYLAPQEWRCAMPNKHSVHRERLRRYCGREAAMQPSTATPFGSAGSRRAQQSIVVVLNPVAGRDTGRRERPRLEAALQRACERFPDDATWEIRETSSPGSGTDIARRAAEEGASIVAAAGGDGTLCEVVNGIVGTRARLGLLPLGTGNDFARSLGLAGDIDLAARTLIEGEAAPVDLGKIEDRWFINIAGCGFDAVVARRVNRGFRWLRGTAAYVAAVLQSLATYKPAEMRLNIDGEKSSVRAMLCCLANTESYGGGMRIAPAAKIDDGLLDVCILEKAGTIEFLRAFPRVFAGTHVDHPKFRTCLARRVEIDADQPLPILVDGDVTHSTPAKIRVVPGAIEVMRPVCRPDSRES